MLRFARFLLSISLFLVASEARTAFASSSFPPTIKAELGLMAAPACTLCHRSDVGGFGTVVTPFGRTMMNRLGTTAANISSLKAALVADEAQHLDSDGDGVSDIDELQTDMDPNVGASGEVAGPDVPPLQTGCSFGARAPIHGAGAFALTAFALVLARRRSRRMQSMLRVAALGGPSLVVLAGCSLDARQLHVDSGGGQAGAELQPLLHAGVGGSSAGAPPAEDAGSEQTPLIGGCPDLDGNFVADCSETLLRNGDFKLNVEDWTPEPGTHIAWDEDNAAADLPSGSALLTVTALPNTGVGAAPHLVKQCLALSGAQLVIVYANALTHDEQGTEGYAEVDVSFFDTDACAGPSASSFKTPQPGDALPDEWLTLKGGAVSGESTRSVLVALRAFEPPDDSSFSARFDNVLLKKQPP